MTRSILIVLSVGSSWIVPMLFSTKVVQDKIRTQKWPGKVRKKRVLE